MNFKNFKLKGIHIFVILLGALLLVSLLRPIMEGFDNNDNDNNNNNNNNNNNVDIPSFLESVSEKTGNLINSVESKLTPSNGVNNNRDVSYVGPAGDTVLVDNPRQPMQPMQPMPSMPSMQPPTQPQSLGIPKSQIPEGSEDLYILKSQVVPPVCPACPTVSACPRPAPYPPCPPCARCPEPAFDCKKVPNYKSENTYLPRPVLADFSQFGM